LTVSKRLIATVAVGLAIAAIGAGCGGGAGSDSASAPISKTEFVNRGNAICEATHSKVRSEIASLLRGHEPKNAGEAIKAEAEVGRKVLIPAMRDQAQAIGALGAPAGDEVQVKAIVAATEEGLGKAAKHPERAVKDGTEAFGKADRLARAYGLTAC
jgi:hypothetical protein